MAVWIATVHHRYPGARFVVLGDVEWQHDHLDFAWGLFDGSGRELLNGRSFGELDTQGRFASLVGFIGRRPLAPALVVPAASVLRALPRRNLL